VKAHGAKKVFVQFSASWCQPCESIKGDLEKFSEEFGEKLAFVYVDCEECEEVAEAYEVTDMPTFKILENLRPVATQLGTKLDKIREFIQEHSA